MDSKKGMGMSEMSGDSMNYMSSMKGMGKSQEPAPGGANVFGKMSEKSAMMGMSYKGSESYVYPKMSIMSMMSSKGYSEGAAVYSMKSKKSGSKSSMSFKGKGG